MNKIDKKILKEAKNKDLYNIAKKVNKETLEEYYVEKQSEETEPPTPLGYLCVFFVIATVLMGVSLYSYLNQYPNSETTNLRMLSQEVCKQRNQDYYGFRVYDDRIVVKCQQDNRKMDELDIFSYK